MAGPEETLPTPGEERFAPIIGAMLTNAFYSAELLHAQKGIAPPREDIHHEVMKIWLELTGKILRVMRQDMQ